MTDIPDEAVGDEWTEYGEFSQFFAEGHRPVSRSTDGKFREWLSETTGYEWESIERVEIQWTWETTPEDNRPITVATVRW